MAEVRVELASRVAFMGREIAAIRVRLEQLDDVKSTEDNNTYITVKTTFLGDAGMVIRRAEQIDGVAWAERV
jgi:hypothetical protein